MAKPLYEITFRLVDNRWMNVSGDSATTLADYLRSLDIIVDDKCEFARFKDYDKNWSIWYRAQAMKVTITIWQINIL